MAVKAVSDLRAADIDLRATPPLLEDALFHCQQATEKSLKAYLTFHDIPFRKTHSLEELGEASLRIDRSLSALVEDVVPLTEYAWVFPYPGEPRNPSLGETEAGLTLAHKLYGAIRTRIPKEAHPTEIAQQ